MPVQVPEWVKHAVFYQIFPDRFARSPRNQLPRGLTFKPWGSPPAEEGFQGGDLYGVVDRLDYLQELGVTAIYLNPVFASASNHRYHTYDYFQVDPLLGGDAALRELVDELHRRDMRVILDGVFNHASRGFWPFHHVLETGGNSPYLDWFYIHDWPLIPYPPDGETSPNYGAWWDMAALPKLNVANPGMREYLLAVAAYWIEFGVDGWRLDVPEEIDDIEFWQEFRRVVKGANPEAYIVGEIWHEAVEWLQGDRFDAAMNYVFSRAALQFFGGKTLQTDYEPGGFELAPIKVSAFVQAVEEMVGLHDWETMQVQLNLMDSHDTARTLWTVGEDESALRLCTLFQMTMPGAPCIYYGDELGFNGADDPYCREAMTWEASEEWSMELLDFFKRAIALRHAHPVLRTGKVETLFANNGVCAFLRRPAQSSSGSPDAAAVVIFNTRLSTAKLKLRGLDTLGSGVQLRDVWRGSGDYTVDKQGQLAPTLQVPPRSGVVLVTGSTAA